MPAKTPVSKRSTRPNIVLTVKKFRDVLSPNAGDPGTEAEIHVEPKKHPNVFMKELSVQDRRDPNETKVLTIKRSNTRLVFRIDAKKGDKDVYYPIGIAFQQRGGPNDGDRTGRDDFAFNTMRLTGRKLEILDNFSDKCGCQESYKFSVMIQREVDGAIGIIDPGLEHEPR